jgi:drug/metabolite transporter (DMT)-like permease
MTSLGATRRSGPLTMLVGYVCFGVAPVFVRVGLMRGLSASGAVVVRFLVALALTAAVTSAGRYLGAGPDWLVRPVNTGGLIWRGIFGGAAVITYFYAVRLTGAGMGTLLNCTYSLWANVFAVVLGRYRPDRLFWPLLGVGGSGLLLIVDPSGPHSRWGILVGVLSGMAAGASLLTIKTLRATDNAVTINFALSIGGLIVATPIEVARLASFGMPPAAMGPLLLLMTAGVFHFLGQILINHGFKHTSVALASALVLLTPVLATALGWAFLGERLTPHYLLGAVLILAACSLLGYRELREGA